jgi:manganese efflux pump family protein
MSTWELLVIAVGLSMDAVAVSLAASATNRAQGRRAAFRLSFHFGLFQAMMPVIGWALGVSVAPHIASIDHWIAFGLLAFVGGRMIYAAFSGGAGDENLARDPSRGTTLVMLSVATSIDALAIGLTLAMLGHGIWYAALLIGLVTGSLSLAAILVGRRAGAAAGARMEVLGGVALIAIGVKILAEHL